MFSSFSPSRLPGSYLDASPYARPSAPASGAATAYRYPGGPQPPPAFANRPGESVALAYNQLMSSMAAHLQQQQQQHQQQQQQQQQQQHGKASASPGVLENLEKLAALASGATPAAK